MKRVSRAGFLAVLIVALFFAFSFSMADESVPRRLCDSGPYRYGFNLARQGPIIYAMPANGAVDNEKVGGKCLSDTVRIIYSLAGEKRPTLSFRRCPARVFRSSGSLIRIYVNHPNHAPPSEI